MKSIKSAFKPIVFFIPVIMVLWGCLFSNEQSNSERASTLVDEGNSQYSKQEYSDAATSYGNAISKDSSNSQAYPGLIKSIIKRDSLVEKYFDINLFSKDSLHPKFLDVDQNEKNQVYQELIKLRAVCSTYASKAEKGELDDDFVSVHGVVRDVELMFQIAKMQDYNYDGIINDDDVIE